jgi:hypothetical protein
MQIYLLLNEVVYIVTILLQKVNVGVNITHYFPTGNQILGILVTLQL